MYIQSEKVEHLKNRFTLTSDKLLGDIQNYEHLQVTCDQLPLSLSSFGIALFFPKPYFTKRTPISRTLFGFHVLRTKISSLTGCLIRPYYLYKVLILYVIYRWSVYIHSEELEHSKSNFLFKFHLWWELTKDTITVRITVTVTPLSLHFVVITKVTEVSVNPIQYIKSNIRPYIQI